MKEYKNLTRLGERRIQKMKRIALGERECQDGELNEGNKIEVWYRKVK